MLQDHVCGHSTRVEFASFESSFFFSFSYSNFTIKGGKLMRMGFIKARKGDCVLSVAKSETRSRVQLERDRLISFDALVG
jgi:hypothetical protein